MEDRYNFKFVGDIKEAEAAAKAVFELKTHLMGLTKVIEKYNKVQAELASPKVDFEKVSDVVKDLSSHFKASAKAATKLGQESKTAAKNIKQLIKNSSGETAEYFKISKKAVKELVNEQKDAAKKQQDFENQIAENAKNQEKELRAIREESIKEGVRLSKAYYDIIEEEEKEFNKKAKQYAKTLADFKNKEAKRIADEDKRLNEEIHNAIMIQLNKQQIRKDALNSAVRAIRIDDKAALDLGPGRKISKENQLAYAQQVASLQNLVKQHNLSSRVVDKVWGDVAKGNIKNYSGALGDLQKRVSNVQRSQDRLQRGLDISSRSMEKSNSIAKELTLSWKSMARVATVQLAHRALSSVTTAIRESISAFIELEKRIGEIRTISQNASQSQEVWADQLYKLSDAFGLDVVDQAEAAYQALSNQVVEGAEAIEFLRKANELAITTNSSVADSVNSLSSILNAFQLETYETDEVTAALFKTIELGRVRLNEMGQELGTVSKLAAQLGLSYNDLFGIIDTLTIQGVQFAKANTQIRGIFIKLLKPTKEMKKLLREIGVESGEAAIQTYGFWELMKRLDEATEGSSTKIAKYINRIRGLSGALTITGQGLKDAQQNAIESENAMESYTKAIEIAFTTLGKRTEIEVNKIKNFFIKDFGKGITETFTDIADSFGGLAAVVKEITYLFIELAASGIVVWLTKVGHSMAAATIETWKTKGAVTALSGALKSLGPIILTGAIAAFLELQRTLKEITNERIERQFNQMVQASDEAFKNIEKFVVATGRTISDQLDESVAYLMRQIAQSRAGIFKELDKIEKDLTSITPVVERALSASTKELTKYFSKLDKWINAAENTTGKLADTISDIQAKIRTSGSFIDAVGGNPAQQLKAYYEALEKFRAEQDKAIKAGQNDLVADISKEIISVYEKIIKFESKLSKGSGYSMLISRDRLQQDYLKLLEQQEKIQTRILEQSERELNLLKAKKATEAIVTDSFKNAFKDYQDSADVLGKEYDEVEDKIRAIRDRIADVAKLQAISSTKAFQDIGINIDQGLLQKEYNELIALLAKEAENFRQSENAKALKDFKDLNKQRLKDEQDRLNKSRGQIKAYVTNIQTLLKELVFLKPAENSFLQADLVLDPETVKLMFEELKDGAGDMSRVIEKNLQFAFSGKYLTAITNEMERLGGVTNETAINLAGYTTSLQKIKTLGAFIQAGNWKAVQGVLSEVKTGAQGFLRVIEELDERDLTGGLNDELTQIKSLFENIVNQTGEWDTGIRKTATDLLDAQKALKGLENTSDELIADYAWQEYFIKNQAEKFADVKGLLDKIKTVTKDIVKEAEKEGKIQGKILATQTQQQKVLQNNADLIAKINLKLAEAQRLEIAILDGTRQAIFAAGSLLNDQLQEVLDELGRKLGKAGKDVESLKQKLAEFARQAQQEYFQYGLEGKTDKQKAGALISRITELRKQSKAAAAAGDVDSFDRLRGQIKSLFDQYKDLAKSSPQVQDFNAQEAYVKLAREEYALRKKMVEEREKERDILQETYDKVFSQQRRIQEGMETFADIDFEKLVGLDKAARGPIIDEMIAKLKDLAKIQAESGKEVIDPAEIAERIKQLEKLKNTDPLQAITAGANNLAQKMKDAAAYATDLRKELGKVADLLNSLSSAGKGIPGFAKGGMNTDSLLAKVSPGEFIVNPAASRKFYSQLVAMNSFKGFADGGPVGNTTIGDINVNYRSSGNSAVDAQALARELRRGIRQGVLKL